jgi:hypothetical protein
MGDVTAAREHYLGALGLLGQNRGDPQISRCLTGLGRVALDRGDLGEARAFLTQSLTLSLRVGSRGRISSSLMAFAALVLREGHPDRALQLAAAAVEARDAVPPQPGEAGGRAVQPSARARRYLDAAASLGEAEVSRLWSTGLKLTPAAAAELAMEPPG